MENPNLILLKEARKIVKKSWTQKVFARDADGYTVTPENKNAKTFCAIGALSRASQKKQLCMKDSKKQLQKISKDVFGCSVESVNDNLGHNEVLKIYQIAIDSYQPKWKLVLIKIARFFGAFR